MSKVGKKTIIIPSGVKVESVGNEVKVQGANGNAVLPILKGITVAINGTEITVTPENATKQIRSNWGTMRALIQNAVSGATADFSKELIIEGIGFRAEVQGKDLLLNLGFSHPVRAAIPEKVKVSVDKNIVRIAGADKREVGDFAAYIRRLKKPEPYKGKGIRYSDEVIRRKAGKKAVTSGGKAA